MPKSGRQKLEIRVSDLFKDAHHAQEGEAGLLDNVPTLTAQQLTILDQRSDMRGVYKKHVARDFRSALRRHRNHQLRAYAQNCRNHARALRKLIKTYIEMPGISV